MLLTIGAMVFSNVLLVFMISLQVGSYEMMINNTLQAFSGHLQVQAAGYNDNPKMRSSVPDVLSLTGQVRAALPGASVAARALDAGAVVVALNAFAIYIRAARRVQL